MKAVALARVSTREQEETGHSLPAQLESLRKYAKKNNFQLVKEFCFSESAGPKIRTKFEEVLDYIRQNKDVKVLLCENVDRATRNFRDAVDLDDMRINEDLEIHFVKDGFFINKNATGNQMFMWEAKVFLAKQYLNRLSDDVKRSVRQKLENGQWIGVAPLGYLNVTDELTEDKNVIPDPNSAHLIKKMFELYATGNYSLKLLKMNMDKLGLVGKSGKTVSTSLMHATLKNPFYIGKMKSKGVEYDHKYETFVPKFIWQRCQDVFESYNKGPFKQQAIPFMFRGLIKCEKCGCMITPEIKKGKYVYYSCTNYKGKCTRVWIPEAKLLEPVYEALRAIQMPDERIKEITDGLKALGQSEARFYKHSIDSLKAEHDKIEGRIGKMYDDKLDGRITQDMYDTKLREYKERQNELFNEMKSHSGADEEFYITANTVFNLGKRALEIFESSEPTEKRQLLNYLLQNCRLSGKTLGFTLRSPFDKVVLTSTHPIGLRGQDSNLEPSPYT